MNSVTQFHSPPAWLSLYFRVYSCKEPTNLMVSFVPLHPLIVGLRVFSSSKKLTSFYGCIAPLMYFTAISAYRSSTRLSLFLRRESLVEMHWLYSIYQKWKPGFDLKETLPCLFPVPLSGFGYPLSGFGFNFF